MEYNSFYGGRKGTPFIIVKDYKDIPSMVNDFSEGGDFTDVNYDEYVLINTYNKNHPDNGKVFRRGYDYNSGRTIQAYRAYTDANHTNEIINGSDQAYAAAYYQKDQSYDAGGAVYIGTIVGPAGKAPMLELTTYENAAAQSASEGFDERKTNGSYSVENDCLVPGKDGTTFNDDIQWYCTCIRNENDEDSQAYIGFKIPYPVIEFQTSSVSTYDENGDYADTSDAIRVDNETHPFYEKWNINIPKGIKGDSLQNLRVITPVSTDIIYDVNTNTQYSDFDSDVTNEAQIVVYDYYNYDDSITNPTKITYYVGKYAQISDINLQNDGTLTITKTDGTSSTFTEAIKWIDEIVEDENEEGKILVRYNTGEEEDFQINQVLNMIITKNEIDDSYAQGHLLVLFSAQSYQGSITYNNISGWSDLGYMFDTTEMIIAIQAVASSVIVNDLYIQSNTIVDYSDYLVSYGLTGNSSNSYSIIFSLPNYRRLPASGNVSVQLQGTGAAKLISYNDDQSTTITFSNSNTSTIPNAIVNNNYITLRFNYLYPGTSTFGWMHYSGATYNIDNWEINKRLGGDGNTQYDDIGSCLSDYYLCYTDCVGVKIDLQAAAVAGVNSQTTRFAYYIYDNNLNFLKSRTINWNSLQVYTDTGLVNITQDLQPGYYLRFCLINTSNGTELTSENGEAILSCFSMSQQVMPTSKQYYSGQLYLENFRLRFLVS